MASQLPWVGAVGQHGVVAKEFAARVDHPIAVAVQHDQAVVTLDPAGGGFDAVGVVVKEDGVGGVDAYGFEAVVVEVEGEGVAGGLDILRTTEMNVGQRVNKTTARHPNQSHSHKIKKGAPISVF